MTPLDAAYLDEQFRPSSGEVVPGPHGGAADTLPVVAGKINAFLDKADQASKKVVEYRISAGRLLIEARERVDSGEAGENVTWSQWLRDNVKRSERDCRRVMKIAGAADPQTALAREREANRAQRAERREADIAMSGDGTPVDRPRQHDDLLRMLCLANVHRWPERERVQFAFEVIAALGLGPDDLQSVGAEVRYARP